MEKIKPPQTEVKKAPTPINREVYLKRLISLLDHIDEQMKILEGKRSEIVGYINNVHIDEGLGMRVNFWQDEDGSMGYKSQVKEPIGFKHGT